MLTDDQGYRLIDIGIDKNIVVFDSEDRGYVTKRLIFTMKHECPDIDTILIPSNEYVEDLPSDWVFFDSLKIFGINIKWDSRLVSQPEKGTWLRYYDMRDCSLAGTRHNLIIGYDDVAINSGGIVKHNVILGSC